MTNKNQKKRNFQGMSYREIQLANSNNRAELHKQDKKWLKDNNYKNIGWENVINLYKKIEEVLERYSVEDLTLEELFLEADRIGNKYLTNQEIEDFNQKLSQEVNQIAEEIDKQFPDTQIEVIDFTPINKRISRKPNN
jgi:hypothetical protein